MGGGGLGKRQHNIGLGSTNPSIGSAPLGGVSSVFGTGVGGLGAQQAANDACELAIYTAVSLQYVGLSYNTYVNISAAVLAVPFSVSTTPLSNGSCHNDACGIWR